ncbi:MAG: helix-turn-helix transcriptional regulator [Bdellovibrionales bacterium]|nr:helix-turn-helix transcriptional regulator [Bdellovibrionales bacterium]
MNLKSQLRLFLQSRGISASDLARLSGVPKQSISDWLGGTAPRDIQKLKRVADAFGTTIDHLVFGEGVPEKPASSPRMLEKDQWIQVKFEGRIKQSSLGSD